MFLYEYWLWLLTESTLCKFGASCDATKQVTTWASPVDKGHYQCTIVPPKRHVSMFLSCFGIESIGIVYLLFSTKQRIPLCYKTEHLKAVFKHANLVRPRTSFQMVPKLLPTPDNTQTVRPIEHELLPSNDHSLLQGPLDSINSDNRTMATIWTVMWPTYFYYNCWQEGLPLNKAKTVTPLLWHSRMSQRYTQTSPIPQGWVRKLSQLLLPLLYLLLICFILRTGIILASTRNIANVLEHCKLN